MQDSDDDASKNVRTIRSLYDDALSGGRTSLLHDMIAPELPGGPAGFEAVVTELRAAFPDIRYTIEDVFGERDRVAVRWTWRGTHRAPFRGHAATGREVSNTGMAIYGFREGRITSAVVETDRLAFLQRIGAVPSDEGRAAPPPAIQVRHLPGGVYLVDTFAVPAAARAGFEAAMRRNREHIRNLAGFRGDAVLFREREEQRVEIVTIAAWESPAAISAAKESVVDLYRRIGFDMPAALSAWGVTLQRATYTAPAELQ